MQFCPNDKNHNTATHCLYWRTQTPQKACWLDTSNKCEVLKGDEWFTKMFNPIK